MQRYRGIFNSFLIFVVVKVFYFFLIPVLLFSLTACPRNSEPSINKLQSSGMDFPDPEQRAHDGIKYKLSKLFTDSYYTDYVIQDKATTKTIYDLYVHFSIETFNKSDIQTIEFLSESKKDQLSMVHDHYIDTRCASLSEFKRSIRKKIPKSVGFPGYLQVVEGGSTYDEKWATYMTASVLIDEKVFVFQLIGNKDHMGYFYDDFITILNSIEK